MTGDSEADGAVPLTNGFARTGYEQEQAATQKIEGQAAKIERNGFVVSQCRERAQVAGEEQATVHEIDE